MFAYFWPYLYVNKTGSQQYDLFVFIPIPPGKKVVKSQWSAPNYSTRLNTLLVTLELAPDTQTQPGYLHQYIKLQPQKLAGGFDPDEYGVEVAVKIAGDAKIMINKFSMAYSEADHAAKVLTHEQKIALNCPYVYLENKSNKECVPYVSLWPDATRAVAGQYNFPVADGQCESVLLLGPIPPNTTSSQTPVLPSVNGVSYQLPQSAVPGFFKPWIAEISKEDAGRKFLALSDQQKKAGLQKSQSQYFSGPPKSVKKSNATSHSNPNIFIDEF